MQNTTVAAIILALAACSGCSGDPDYKSSDAVYRMIAHEPERGNWRAASIKSCLAKFGLSGDTTRNKRAVNFCVCNADNAMNGQSMDELNAGKFRKNEVCRDRLKRVQESMNSHS